MNEDHNSIGAKRLEYLDLANKTYSDGNVQVTQNYIDAFLVTIKEDSEMAKDIQTEFDDIEKKKKETWEMVVKETMAEDLQLQAEHRSNALQSIAIQSIRDRMDACWKVCLKHGAFND